jgi:hypothetical protein
VSVTKRAISAVAVLFLLLAVVGTLWSVTWMSDQVTNSMRVQLCERQVLDEAVRTGHLPAVWACDDWWGKRIAYVRWPEGFALISYGRDGVANDDWSPAKLGNLRSSSTCLHPDIDTVIVGGGARHVCLK